MDILCNISFDGDAFQRVTITSPSGTMIDLFADWYCEATSVELRNAYLSAYNYCRKEIGRTSTQVHLSREAMAEALKISKLQKQAFEAGYFEGITKLLSQSQ